MPSTAEGTYMVLVPPKAAWLLRMTAPSILAPSERQVRLAGGTLDDDSHVRFTIVPASTVLGNADPVTSHGGTAGEEGRQGRSGGRPGV